MSDEMRMNGKEGLSYSHDNDKFKHTPLNDNFREMGKLKSGEGRAVDPAHMKAEEARLKGMSSHDPMYKNQHKDCGE